MISVSVLPNQIISMGMGDLRICAGRYGHVTRIRDASQMSALDQVYSGGPKAGSLPAASWMMMVVSPVTTGPVTGSEKNGFTGPDLGDGWGGAAKKSY